MSSPRFAPHGSFSLARDGAVYVLSVEGPWNRETFDAYISAVSGRTGEKSARWGGYCEIAGEALVAPELVPLWRESNAMLARSGLAAVAYRFTDADLSPFYRDVFRRSLGEAPFAFDFFDSRTAAMVWLGEMGLCGA